MTKTPGFSRDTFPLREYKDFPDCLLQVPRRTTYRWLNNIHMSSLAKVAHILQTIYIQIRTNITKIKKYFILMSFSLQLAFTEKGGKRCNDTATSPKSDKRHNWRQTS